MINSVETTCADNPISIVLVDDHAAVRAGYRMLLEADTRLTVLTELSSGEEAYQQFEKLNPEVMIMDLSMPGMGGLESIKRIVGKYPQAKILVFTMHDNPLFAEHAINAGARGYITKSSAPNELINAVKTVAAGDTYLDDSIDSLVFSEKQLRRTNPFSQLSNREFQILCLCAEGDDVAKIADRLSLSSKTVANYLTQIKEKLQVNSTAQLVRLAIQHKIINI